MNAITSAFVNAMPTTFTSQNRTGSTAERVFSVTSLSPWQVAAIQRVAAFRSLAADWDSYGSPAIGDSVIDRAIDIIGSTNLEDLSPTRIVPLSGGGIQFEWQRGNREIELAVYPDLSTEALLVENDSPTGDSIFNPSIVRILSWLDAG